MKKYLPLCGLHYHQCVSGKCLEVELKEGFGIARFNSKTQTIDYPKSVPKDRLPVPAAERPRKGLMMAMLTTTPDPDVRPVDQLEPSQLISGGDEFGVDEIPDGRVSGGPVNKTAIKGLRSKVSPATVVFYVNSGAGQCLSSCSTAFRALEPCQLEVVGVAGSIPIFGIGTAIFALALAGGSEVLVRVHNCLYSFGEFNLLSISQMKTNPATSIDLLLVSPNIRLYSADNGGHRSGKPGQAFIDVPLEMDDGLYALVLEPVSSDDTRYLSSRIFDLTPPGEYSPVSQKAERVDEARGSYPRSSSKDCSPSRVLGFPFGANLL
jgi:hypothetical protein